jgi:hypothetical protein
MTQGESSHRVVVDDPPRTCLLGLLMRDLLERNLARPEVAGRIRSLRGDVQVGAGRMVVTLVFGGETPVIRQGGAPRPRARVGGTFPAMLDVVTGRSLLRPLLTGAIRVGGDALLLLRILPVLRAGDDA